MKNLTEGLAANLVKKWQERPLNYALEAPEEAVMQAEIGELRAALQERKPLTDEQITEVWRELRAQKEDWSDLDFARAIEAYIKEQPAPVQAGAQPAPSKPRYVLAECPECRGGGESKKYGFDDYSYGVCEDCRGTGKAPVLAVAPEPVCRACAYLQNGECIHSHGPLNPCGDYCGGQVLTRKVQPAPKQEPFGYVSEHNCQGPFQFQFHKESATVYTDNCKSITPVYSTPVQAQERKPFGYYDPSTKQFAIDKDELPRGAVVWPVYRDHS